MEFQRCKPMMNDLEIANISEEPSLEYLIQKAILKVNGKNEASLCRFIPFKSGGYMHRFLFKKMKQKNPEELHNLIQAHIIQVDNPQEISVKPSDQFTTYKKESLFIITKTEMDCIIALARQAGDDKLLEAMSRKQGFYPEEEKMD
jgi:hypothetical protein